ncbi:MAG: cation:proton antiporter [Ruminococcaceae bacterium]|nr:cation:proton antiporter [Oscillospiraceae bacterium]
MEAYSIFKSLCIIIIGAKLCGIIARKLKAPQVVGEIIAGVLLGPSVFGWVEQSDFLTQLAEIGVVLLMFSAGLQTNLQDLVRTGIKAFAIACSGVFVPLVGGTLLYFIFYGVSPVGSPDFYKAVFIGVIMTATSVSITAQTLKELGKISSEVGTTIMSAAIIDDVIGIIVLTFVIGINGGDVKPLSVIIKTLLFFVFAFFVGYVIYKIFRFSDKMWPHTRRIPIMGLALCLGLAYVAERFFGIADITGAYVAGIILCSIHDSDYIAEKMDISSYMLFGPVFFASIGLKTDLEKISPELIFFIIGFVAVALVCKIIGCGAMARICKFNTNDSFKIGVGMMTRGEVALIVAQKGLSSGIITSAYFAPVIVLILTSSIITPIILKTLYSREAKKIKT